MGRKVTISQLKTDIDTAYILSLHHESGVQKYEVEFSYFCHRPTNRMMYTYSTLNEAKKKNDARNMEELESRGIEAVFISTQLDDVFVFRIRDKRWVLDSDSDQQHPVKFTLESKD